MDVNRKPAIRFKGFSGDWELREFTDMFDCSIPNNTLSRAGLNYNSGEIKSVHYGDILVKYGAITDVAKDKIPYITDANMSKYKDHLLNNGDILIADTAEDETVGKATELANIGDNLVVSGLHTIVCRPNVDMQVNYLGYYMNSSAYHRQLLPLMQGIKVLAISRSNLTKTFISYPALSDEQRNIGTLFKYLDHLITFHQRRHDKLQNVKKSMLEKMFPKKGADVPEIRFKGFTDAWEQRKLATIYQKIRNAFVGTATPHYVEDGHFYLESNNVKDGQINTNSKIYINDEFYERQKDNWLHTGDLVMVQSGHVGHSAVIPKELNNTAAHALIIMADPTDKTNPYFINYQFQTQNTKDSISNITTGNTIKHILSSEMKKFGIYVADYDEQTQIGAFFKHLDNLITLHQRKLEKLQNIKKFCLEKMFV